MFVKTIHVLLSLSNVVASLPVVLAASISTDAQPSSASTHAQTLSDHHRGSLTLLQSMDGQSVMLMPRAHRVGPRSDHSLRPSYPGPSDVTRDGNAVIKFLPQCLGEFAKVNKMADISRILHMLVCDWSMNCY